MDISFSDRKEAGRYRSWLENHKNPKVELARERREQEEAKTFDDAFLDSKSSTVRVGGVPTPF